MYESVLEGNPLMNIRNSLGKINENGRQDNLFVSETTTIKSNSNEQLEHSIISNLSRDSIGRDSVKSFNSNSENRSIYSQSLSKNTNYSAENFGTTPINYEKNAVFQSNFHLTIALQNNSCFNPLIVEDLIISRSPSRKKFYTLVFDLMIEHSHDSQFFSQPIKNRLYLHKMNYSKTVLIEPEEILSQLLAVENTVDFVCFLKVFFLNIYELIMEPIKVLLLLIQEFFFEPSLNLTASERKCIRERLAKGVKDRILLFLQIWIKKREKDFLFGKEELPEILYCFITYIKKSKYYVHTFKNRIATLTQYILYLRDHKKKLETFLQSLTRRNILSHQFCPEEEITMEETNLNELFQNTSNECISNTLFVIDMQLFFRLGIYELNPDRISSTKNRSVAYSDYIYRLNTFTYFYVYLILSQQDELSMVAMIKKLLRLARLMRTGSPMNLEGYNQIKLAFMQPSIYDLPFLKNSLTNKKQRYSMESTEMIEYLRISENTKESFEDILTSLKAIQNAFVPSFRYFAQYIGTSNDRWGLLVAGEGGRKYLNMEKVAKYNEVYNFMDKMHSSESAKKQLIEFEVYKSKTLYFFLERGYLPYLSSNLNVQDLERHQTQDVLYRMSRNIIEKSNLST